MKMWMRRCVLGILWILSLVLISFYGGAVSYGFFFGVTLIPVISLVYLFCVYHRFKIYQETGKREIVCGRPEPYFFVLKNEDLFAFTSVSVRMHSFFSYVEDSFENVEYELLPGDRITCETRIVCKYRGEYEVGVKEVVVTDLFRLFRFTYTVSGQIKAVAAPRVVQLGELRSIQDLPVLLQREAAGASEPDILVRDYVEGDSLKQIHWKATAREGKLKVRVLTGRENQSLYLFCETKRYGETAREYLPLENKLLEVFLAVSFFFAEKNREFYACFGQGGAVRERVDGMGTFQKLYEKVKEIEFGKEDLGDVMTQVLERNSLGGGAVFIILHELKPEILEITERLTAGGTMVVLYLVADEVTGASPASWADARRKVIVIPVEAELEGRL